ncbi:MAG TPA: hypothetical protein VFO59_04040 [Dehalococcoidia bacterium]|nr:hypothetical protein [Dehalococcoidia bacterium]
MSWSKVFAVLIAVSVLVIAACGDDDDDDGVENGSASPTASRSPSATGADETPQASPDGTGQPSLSPTPAPTAAAPTPRPPSLAAGVRKIGEGTMTFTLLPEGEFPLDPLALIQPGTTAPPCAAFVFAFSWQITDPFPPGANTLIWRITRQDVTEDVGLGASGSDTVGCGQLMAVNDGPDTINVSVWYIQGEIQS